VLKKIVRKAKRVLKPKPAPIPVVPGSDDVLGKFSAEVLEDTIEALAHWYHRIDLGLGLVTPGKNNMSLVFDLYRDRLPDSLEGMTVLDLGSNAGGLSIEFARRGAKVTSLELDERYASQAEFLTEHFGLQDRIEIHCGDLYSLLKLDSQFDIVCYVGLSYHLRHPQLALDLLSRVCRGQLLVSSQTIEGHDLTMSNRARRLEHRSQSVLYGWEPTETLFASMIAHAGFLNTALVSTMPHRGELPPVSICGNRSYFIAEAAAEPMLLPFVDSAFVGKP
jgi:2-polyprenyl-3-methyl-5-hydroxy-6-metoxy-1,4-benzoquinol methylase